MKMSALVRSEHAFESDVAELDAALALPSFSPALLDEDAEAAVEADWGIVAAVAALLGLAIAVVAYICSVCEARSFDACRDAVVNYFGGGC
ncbi:hypothetical protein [Clavibacter nebraskensis]|uniref:hypothetical protein n=1 Tax=Clavibacter nebraskensis TaxID=31963 RepID=UPI003DA70E8E